MDYATREFLKMVYLLAEGFPKKIAQKIHYFPKYTPSIAEKEPSLVHIRDNDRIHISETEVIELESQTSQKVGEKPKGLWYSFGKQWMHFLQDWDESREYLDKTVNKDKNIYKLTIDLSKVCALRSKKHIDQFIKKYGQMNHVYNIMQINWENVSRDYSGIEIPNYHSLSMRNWHEYDKLYYRLYFWLYTWDVSSGCVWNKDAIINFKKLEPRMPY